MLKNVDLGLRTQHRTVCSTSQHSTTRRSDEKLVTEKVGLRTQHGTVCSTSQHSTTRRSDEKLVTEKVGLRTQHGTVCSTIQTQYHQKLVTKEAGLERSTKPSDYTTALLGIEHLRIDSMYCFAHVAEHTWAVCSVRDVIIPVSVISRQRHHTHGLSAVSEM